MVLDFKIKKKGHEFLLDTGLSMSRLMDYKQEYEYLNSFERRDECFVIPRSKLCDVLDKCFDHFTEESLMEITKLLDKNDEVIREKITEHSVSKKKKTVEKKVRERLDTHQEDKKEDTPREMYLREKEEEKRRSMGSVRVERKPDLNYDDPVPKTELLKMFYNIKSQMDVMEKYLHRMK